MVGNRMKPHLPKEKIKGVLFDVYNTLIFRYKSDLEMVLEILPPFTSKPSAQEQVKARNAVMDYYNEERHQDWAVTENNKFWRIFYSKYLEALNIEDPELILAEKLAFWSRSVKSYRVEKDAIKVINTLTGRKYRVGLLSNWDTSLKSMCSQLNLSADMILASDEIGIRKPDPRIFEIGCQQLGLKPESVLYVGDSLRKDIAGSRAAGMYAAWFTPKGKKIPYGFEPEPHLVISGMIDLLLYL